MLPSCYQAVFTLVFLSLIAGSGCLSETGAPPARAASEPEGGVVLGPRYVPGGGASSTASGIDKSGKLPNDHDAAINEGLKFFEAAASEVLSGTLPSGTLPSGAAPSSEVGSVGELPRTFSPPVNQQLSHLEKARNYLESARYQEAVREYRLALQQSPANAQVSFELARALVLAGDRARALPHLNRALEINPHFLEALLERGNLRLASGDAKGAAADYEAARLRAGDKPPILAALANAALARHQHAEALEWSNRAVAADPEYGTAHVLRGFSHILQGDLKAAEADLVAASSTHAPSDQIELLKNRLDQARKSTAH